MMVIDFGRPPPSLGRKLPLLPEIETPAVVVDSDVLDTNLHRMAHLTNRANLDLRPHIKTHKSVTVGRRQLDAGAVGITASKPSEAAPFGDDGFTGIFMAYPPVGGHRLRRIEPLIEHGSLIVGLDDRRVAAELGRRAQLMNRTVRVLFEVDVGMHRAGLLWGRRAATEASAIANLPGVELAGVFTHEGHAHGHDPGDLDGLAVEVADRISHTAELIRADGVECPAVSVGSTLTARYMNASMGVTEIRPGAYVYNDIRTVQGAAARWEDCALTVLTTVVSRPDSTTAIIDAGSKVLSPADGGTYRHGIVAESPTATIIRLSEEHGTVHFPAGEGAPTLGERLHILPVRAGLVVNTQRTAHFTNPGGDSWRVPIEAHLRST
jgi:D-serine deaminase-like pyridoxal phosphate-dependent protein